MVKLNSLRVDFVPEFYTANGGQKCSLRETSDKGLVIKYRGGWAGKIHFYEG